MIKKDNKTGTYYVQYKYKDLYGKWHTTKKRGFTLKRDAQIFEGKMRETPDNSTGNLTFLEVNERFCNSYQVSEGQRRRREVAFEKRFSNYYKKPIKSITKAQLDDWRSWLINETDYSTSIKNATIGFVKSVFTYASDIYNVPNTAHFLKSAKKTQDEIMNQEREVWDVETFNKFIDAVELPLFKIFFKTLFWTGMRRGECMALQKDDFDGKGFNINKQIRHYKNGFTPTKTRTQRYVLLPDFLIPDIQDLIDNQEGTFIFGGDRSISISVIQRQFVNGKKNAGIDDGVVLHGLRHSHATWLINNGVNIVAVSKRLGHADIETTLRRYTHLLTDTDQKMMDIMNNISH